MKKDYFGKDTSGLREKRLFLMDMDGTIYNEDRLFDGTIELLKKIIELDGKYVFISNNSSRSVMDYISKINNFGIAADDSNFFTSTMASSIYLNQHFRGKKIYVQGTHSMISELEAEGVDVTTEVSDEAAAILIGFDTEVDFEKIRKTCIMLMKDIPYIATNPDMRCPVSFGYVPDCGSMSQAYKNATGREPFFIGKPRPFMIEAACKKFGYDKKAACIVGDRLYTDILSGVNAGVDTICVLSGEACVEDINNGDVKPTYTLHSVRNILEVLG